jgi:hypothetical protein
VPKPARIPAKVEILAATHFNNRFPRGKSIGGFSRMPRAISLPEEPMKTFHKLFTAICLATIVGLVGCGDPQKSESKPAKADGETKADDAKTPETTTPETTEPEKTEPMKTEPIEENPTTPDENPKATTPEGTDPSPAVQESGSGEKKGGVDIPKE